VLLLRRYYYVVICKIVVLVYCIYMNVEDIDFLEPVVEPDEEPDVEPDVQDVEPLQMNEGTIGELSYYEPDVSSVKYTTLQNVEAALLKELSEQKIKLVTTKLNYLYMKALTDAEKTSDIFEKQKAIILDLNEKLSRVRQKMQDIITLQNQTQEYEKILRASIYNIKTCPNDTPVKEIVRGNMQIQTTIADINAIKDATGGKFVTRTTHYPQSTGLGDNLGARVKSMALTADHYTLEDMDKRIPNTTLLDKFYLQDTSKMSVAATTEMVMTGAEELVESAAGSFAPPSKETIILYIKSILQVSPRLKRELILKKLSQKLQTRFDTTTKTFIEKKVLELKKLYEKKPRGPFQCAKATQQTTQTPLTTLTKRSSAKRTTLDAPDTAKQAKTNKKHKRSEKQLKEPAEELGS
jgi:hypothetical protein